MAMRHGDRTCCAHFPNALRGSLPLRDYAAIRMAEGMVAMSREETDVAITHFDARARRCKPISTIPRSWRSRISGRHAASARRASTTSALSHAIDGRNVALECGYERMAAVMRVLESWLLFQKGKHKEALKILAETESGSCATPTMQWCSGNIQSTYGRIYRQEGRYDRAVHHFTCAIEEYRKT